LSLAPIQAVAEHAEDRPGLLLPHQIQDGQDVAVVEAKERIPERVAAANVDEAAVRPWRHSGEGQLVHELAAVGRKVLLANEETLDVHADVVGQVG